MMRQKQNVEMCLVRRSAEVSYKERKKLIRQYKYVAFKGN